MAAKPCNDIKMTSLTPKCNKFECETCKKSFTRKYSLKCHRNNIHSSNTAKPSRRLKSHIPPLQLGKTMAKKAKQSKKDKLKRYKKLAEDMRHKINEEKEQLKMKVDQKREFKTLFEPARPTYPEYKQTKKITLEWDETDGNKMIVVERLGRKPEFSWPVEWDFKIEHGSSTKKFRAPTPDTFKAYNHYMNKH